MKKNLVKLAFLLLLMFAGNANSEDIYIHDLSGKEGFADILRNKITAQGKTVVIGNTRESLEETGKTKVNWIIYIGHGKSCSGQIGLDLNGQQWISPNELKNKAHWKGEVNGEILIKGVLIFGCAVIDIHDYGQQHYRAGPNADDACAKEEGNYCSKYFNAHGGGCPNSELPDPGLKWEELARTNGIKYILGFNFEAPKIEKGGAEAIGRFLDIWLSDGGGDDKFLEAWKNPTITSSEIERGFIQKGSDGHYWYSMGRASDKGLIWTKLINIKSYREYRSCPFNDISIDDWYQGAVTSLCLKKIVTLDKLFNPGLSETRGAFITKLIRWKKLNCPAQTNQHWAQCNANKAINEGIIDGSKPLRLDESITRAEAAVMAVAAINKQNEDCKVTKPNEWFSDVQDTNQWYFKPICLAKRYGLMNGYDKKFNPFGKLTRAEAAVIVNSVITK
jgi:hypothetical protein